MESLSDISTLTFPLWKSILKKYTTSFSLSSFTYFKNDNTDDKFFYILLEDMKSLNLFDFTVGRETCEINARNKFPDLADFPTWKSQELEFLKSGKNFQANVSEHFGILINPSKDFKNFRFGNFLKKDGFYVQNGFGIAFLNNVTFVGNWFNNMPLGFFLVAGNEHIYYGMIENGNFNGIAKVFTDNIVYFGELKNDVFEGKGMTFNNYGCYVGKFCSNQKMGFGTLRSFCNKSYTGMWKNNLFHGKGTLVVKDNNTYVGRFHMGKRHGYGVCTFLNGNLYKGKWKDDFRHGQGIYISRGGRKRYDGDWKEGQKHGYGVEIYSNYEKYAGTFKYNIRHGRGFLNFSNGCSYHGIFKYGIPYGNGVMYHSNNIIWKEGIFQGSNLHGFGKVYRKNGSIEKEGKFIDGNFVDVDSIMIRKFIETRDHVFLKKISKNVLQKFIQKNYNHLSTNEISSDNSKHFFITTLLSLHKKQQQQKQEEKKETNYDIFGHEIVHPCLGNDGEIYDYQSMSYLFKRKTDGSFENITYVYDENNKPVPKFPIMGNGHILSDFTPILSPAFVTPPRSQKKINLTKTQTITPDDNHSPSISDFVPLHRSLQSEFYSEVIPFNTQDDYL